MLNCQRVSFWAPWASAQCDLVQHGFPSMAPALEFDEGSAPRDAGGALLEPEKASKRCRTGLPSGYLTQ